MLLKKKIIQQIFLKAMSLSFNHRKKKIFIKNKFNKKNNNWNLLLYKLKNKLNFNWFVK